MIRHVFAGARDRTCCTADHGDRDVHVFSEKEENCSCMECIRRKKSTSGICSDSCADRTDPSGFTAGCIECSIILGFIIGSFLCTGSLWKLKSFRGACRVLNKDFYDGVVDTAPLVGFLLMIPMFNKAAELCVPYFNALLGNIIPNNTLVISIVFAILAPLGLFRGPFTLFGCGAATLGS